MRKLKVIWCLMLCWLLCVSAFAAALPDLDRTGTITLTMETESGPVPGGQIALYRVADMTNHSGELDFSYTDSFLDCPYNLEENLMSETLSGQIKNFAQEHQLERMLCKINDLGMMTVAELPAGVYLLCQDQSLTADGYLPMKPFLITVPMADEQGGWLYDVDASPKVSVNNPDDSPTPSPSGPPVPPPTPSIPSPDGGEQIPDTGQMNWPVPVLAVSGLLLFAIGWYIRYSGRDESNET